MTIIRRAAAAAIIALAAAHSVTTAGAAALYTFAEDTANTNVSGTLSGSLDLTGLDGAPAEGLVDRGIWPDQAILHSGSPSTDLPTYDYALRGPTTFGTGSNSVARATTSSGLIFFLDGALSGITLDRAFTGGAVSGTIGFEGQTFASLGVTLGDYVYTFSNGETLTVRFGPAPQRRT